MNEAGAVRDRAIENQIAAHLTGKTADAQAQADAMQRSFMN